MKKAIIGKKLGMTQVFTPEGLVIPVTVVEAGPCPVVQIKNNEKDGYNAVVVAFEKQKAQRVNKPRTGAFKKAGVETYKMVKELKLDGQYNLGQEKPFAVCLYCSKAFYKRPCIVIIGLTTNAVFILKIILVCF